MTTASGENPRDISLEARLRIVLQALEASQTEIRSVIDQLRDPPEGSPHD